MSDTKLKPCPQCQSPHVCIMLSPQQEDGSRFYYGFCYECCSEAGEGDTVAQAAAAWNALPRRLQWTTETPTEPGWYWNRVAGKESLPMRLYYDSDGEFCYQVEGLPDDCWLVEDLADEVGCEWAGPIHEPQEPQR